MTADSTQAGGWVAGVMDHADGFAYSEDLREQAIARDKLLAHLTAHASQQAAVVAGLEKDAARYRWLRADRAGAVIFMMAYGHLVGDQFDAALDHAMKEQP